MPTYVYECRKCGHRFEEFQAITDPPRKRCPKCRAAVRRVLTPGGGLIFKGSGFYITDYRKQEYREKARREAADATPGKSDAAGGSESGSTGGAEKTGGGSESGSPGGSEKAGGTKGA